MHITQGLEPLVPSIPSSSLELGSWSRCSGASPGSGADPSRDGKRSPTLRTGIMFSQSLAVVGFVLLSCCYAPEAPPGKSALQRKQPWQKSPNDCSGTFCVMDKHVNLHLFIGRQDFAGLICLLDLLLSVAALSPKKQNQEETKCSHTTSSTISSPPRKRL